jgi:hypothetical protein
MIIGVNTDAVRGLFLYNSRKIKVRREFTRKAMRKMAESDNLVQYYQSFALGRSSDRIKQVQGIKA